MNLFKRKPKDSYKDTLINSLIEVVAREAKAYKDKKLYLPKDYFEYDDFKEFIKDCEKQQLYAEFYDLISYILKELVNIYDTVETKYTITKKYYK